MTPRPNNACPGMWATRARGSHDGTAAPATDNMEVRRCKGYFVRSSRLFAISLVVLGLSAPSALAANPARDGYLTTPINVPPTVQAASATSVPTTATVTPPTHTGSSLPFTGLDIGLVAGAAVLLLGLGFALRRGTRTES